MSHDLSWKMVIFLLFLFLMLQGFSIPWLKSLISEEPYFAFNMDLVKGKEVLFVQTGFYFIDKSVNNA